MHLIQTIFKSESKKSNLERLHVAGSKGLIDSLNKRDILPVYINEIVDQNNTNHVSFKTKKKTNRELLDSYIDSEYTDALNILNEEVKDTEKEKEKDKGITTAYNDGK